MTPLTAGKVTLAVTGLTLFGYGVRTDLVVWRWTGIGCLGLAFVLRFVGPREPR
jgi:hypothetical protein